MIIIRKTKTLQQMKKKHKNERDEKHMAFTPQLATTVCT